MPDRSPKKPQGLPPKGKSGCSRIRHAFVYSVEGLRAAWTGEAAFRQVSVLAVLGMAVALSMPLPWWGRALLLASHLACVGVELLNSAIEAAVDHTSLARHPLAKRAKDLGSAAQLVCLLNLGLMWGVVLWAGSGGT